MDVHESAMQVLEEIRQVFSRIDTDQLHRVVKRLERANRVFLIGVGREGLSTRAFAMRLMHLGKETHWVWDDTTPSMGSEDLLVATSGSGEIGHIHYAVEQAKKAGTTVVVVTGTPDRKTPSLADEVLWIPACVFHGKDNVVPSIQPMGNLFEQSLLICFDLLIMKMMSELGSDPAEMEHRHRNVE
ncbi:MAG: SIS domain-containing protein [Spirochaetales bacterium]|nr:SIS domain-containing protein [Spirochaetales bacterium]